MVDAATDTPPTIDTDVLIVGGGMVGMSLAAALGHAGIPTVLADRAPAAARLDAAYDGRASAIAWGSAQALAGIGVWSSLAADAEPITDIRVSDGPSRLFLHYGAAETDGAPMGYIVENQIVRARLQDCLAGLDAVTVLAPAEPAALERGPDGVTATLSGGVRVEARLVVGADGRGSAVRDDAGITLTRWSYPQTAIVCTMGHERPHRGVAHERFLPAGPFAVLPMTDHARLGHRSSIVWTERADLAPTMLALDDSAFAAEMAARFGPHLGAVSLLGRRWSHPLSLLHAARYTAPRLALVGDAAHAIHPIAGQGLNLGLRDVAALAEVLVDARRLGLDIGQSTVLTRYARWRRLDTLLLIAVTDGLNRLFSNELPALRLARDLGLAAVNAAPPLKRLFTRHAMGVVGDLPRLLRGETL